MEINMNGGFDACRSLPPGQGIQTHVVGGFRIQMVSNHDADDTFLLRIVALFVPGPRGTMTWRSLSTDQVLKAIAATVGFSERKFGESELDPVDRQLIDAITANTNQ